VQSLASGLVTIDPEGSIVLVNIQAARLLDQTTHKLLRQPANSVFPGIDEELEKQARDEHRFELEIEIANAARQLGCSLGPLRDGKGEPLGWVLHFQDITDLRSLELDARRKERLAAIGRLAASVAHEVRNPLAAMAGSAELIAAEDLAPDDRRLLKIIRREAARLDRLVGDLLTFTTPRALQLQELNISTLVADTVESFRADPTSKSLTVSTKAPRSVSVFVDAGAMSQILWNLLRNASVATNHEGEIVVRIDSEPGRRIIEVVDNGPGVDPKDRERVFQAFESSGQGGFGFGLALVRRLIRDHGGEVSIHDREDGKSGARVRLSLPSQRPPPGSAAFPLESKTSDSASAD
jgi:two-component system sensor histidine kinase PilS (NtrC family)